MNFSENFFLIRQKKFDRLSLGFWLGDRVARCKSREKIGLGLFLWTAAGMAAEIMPEFVEHLKAAIAAFCLP